MASENIDLNMYSGTSVEAAALAYKNDLLFWDTTKGHAAWYMEDGATLKHMLCADSSNNLVNVIGNVIAADGVYYGLGAAKGRFQFDDEATDTITVKNATLLLNNILGNDGDADTLLTFGTDSLLFTIGGVSMIQLSEGATTLFEVNPNQTDVDTIINTNGLEAFNLSGLSGQLTLVETLNILKDSGNANFEALFIRNSDEPTTGQLDQSVSITAYLMQTSDSGSSYANEYAGQILFGKVSDYFNASGQTDNDSFMAFSICSNGTLTERMRLLNSGQLRVSNVDVTNALTTVPILQANGNITTWSTTGGAMFFYRDDTTIVDGDDLGAVSFIGNGGAAEQVGAKLLIEAAGTWASGDAPGRFIFYTTPAASATPVERMRIMSAGLITMESGLKVTNTTAFDLNATPAGQDNIALYNLASGGGINNVGASIVFGGPGRSQRKAAVGCYQGTADVDQCGLAFYTSPSTASNPMVMGMKLDHVGLLSCLLGLSVVGTTTLDTGLSGLLVAASGVVSTTTTALTPQFLRLGIGAAADATDELWVAGTSHFTDVLTLQKDVDNADFQGLVLYNENEPASTEVGQSVSINAKIKGAGTSSGIKSIGSILFGKQTDYESEATQHSFMKFYIDDASGGNTLIETIDPDGITVVGKVACDSLRISEAATTGLASDKHSSIDCTAKIVIYSGGAAYYVPCLAV